MSRQHDSHTFDMFGEAASAHPALSSTPELLALCGAGAFNHGHARSLLEA